VHWQNDGEDRDGADYGQIDGDASPSVNFVPAGAGQPWLRSGTPPWQMWGNTEIVTVAPNAFSNPNVNEKLATLCRVNYKRPETWRFLFSARILDATPAGVGEQSNLSVWFELYTGIGRSAIRIPFWVTLPAYTWSNSNAPIGLVKWTNRASTSDVALTITNDPAGVFISSSQVPVFSEEIVGQDLTVIAHVNHTSNVPGAADARVEVNGQFSPNAHVRPDWYRNGPEEQAFPGAEVEGR
jgi:hypothetical protein